MGERQVLVGYLIDIMKLLMIIQVRVKRPNGQLKGKEDKENKRIKRRKHKAHVQS